MKRGGQPQRAKRCVCCNVACCRISTKTVPKKQLSLSIAWLCFQFNISGHRLRSLYIAKQIPYPKRLKIGFFLKRPPTPVSQLISLIQIPKHST